VEALLLSRQASVWLKSNNKKSIFILKPSPTRGTFFLGQCFVETHVYMNRVFHHSSLYGPTVSLPQLIIAHLIVCLPHRNLCSTGRR